MTKPTSTEFIKWTYEGEEKMVALELAEECVVIKVVDEVVRHEMTPVATDHGTKQDFNKGKSGGCGGCGSKGIKRLLLGGAKLLKAELGIDACPDATIIDRRNLCESCEHYDFGVCDECGCFCAAKVKLKSEKCPKGLW